MRKQYKAYLFLCFSLAALLLGLSSTGVVFAKGHARLASLQNTASQTCGTWSIVPSPNGEPVLQLSFGRVGALHE